MSQSEEMETLREEISRLKVDLSRVSVSAGGGWIDGGTFSVRVWVSASSLSVFRAETKKH